MKIERAKLLAQFVHLGQKRQDGEDYINHCERVANSLFQKFSYGHMKGIGLSENLTEEEENIICAAYLHDCIEDADIKLEMNDFIFNAFGYDIWNLVIKLTYDSKLGSYNEYIELVSQFPEALQIKFLDLIDNTSYSIPKKQWQKYHDACVFLCGKGIEIPKILQMRLKI